MTGGGAIFARGTFAVLRAVLSVAAVLSFAGPLTEGAGLVAAAGASMLALLLGPALGRSRVRGTALGALGLCLLGAGLGLPALLSGSEALAWVAGARPVLLLAELLRWFFLPLAILLPLRAFAQRSRVAGALELLLLVALLAGSVAAHRDGAFHRPYLLGDWAWSRGLDPADLLLALGAGLALLAVPQLLLPAGRRRVGSVVALGLLALGLLLLRETLGRPDPPHPPDTLGLEGEARPARTGDGDPRPGAEARGGRGGRGAQGPEARGGGSQGQGKDEPLRRRDDPAGGGEPPPPDQDFPFDQAEGGGGSERPVAVVVLRSDYDPPEGVYYLRQVAFSQYNGSRLVRSTSGEADVDLAEGFPSVEPLRLVQPPLQPGFRRAVDSTVALLAEHKEPFGLVAPETIRPRANPEPDRFVRSYDVRSLVLASGYEPLLLLRGGDPSWSATRRAHYLALPDDPRYRDVAREATASLGPSVRGLPLPQALAIKRWLEREVIYSRGGSHPDADDPVAPFLFGDRVGYCIHIAHAAVYLLRSLGVPARVAAGYAVEAAQRGGGGTLLLRAGNAHAWPELYLEGVGWVVVDPRPERVQDGGLQPADPQLQRMLGEMARAEGSAAEQQAREEAGLRPWRLPALGPLLGPLAGLLLLALYLRKLGRRVAPWLLPRSMRLAASYRAAADRLSDLGLRRSSGETRPAFARRVAPLSPSFGPLTEHLVAARLGWPERPHPPWPLLRALLAEQSRELRRGVPWWRRGLAWLDPLSSLRTK